MTTPSLAISISRPSFLDHPFLSLLLTAALLLLAPLLSSTAVAANSEWDLDPGSSDWNDPANWTPEVVPNGPEATAIFGVSNTTDISISANTEVNGIIFTSAATNPYFITMSSGLTLTLSGIGIQNNSGTQPIFSVQSPNEATQMRFTNSASAGNAHISWFGGNSGGDSLQFLNSSTADTAFISFEHSAIDFFDDSTAGNAFFASGGGWINFFNSSTAGSATSENFGFHGSISFYDNSTADNASLHGGESGSVGFFGHSTAGNATIFCGQTGVIEFSDFSNAASASIQVFGSEMFFSGLSEGGASAIELFTSGGDFFSSLDISGHNVPGVTIGSLEGDEAATVFLGANILTVGSNNLSTTFFGVIQDGGSLAKIGTGTLTLSGANTYTGGTMVSQGTLVVSNTSGSATGTGPVQVNVGTLGGGGTISGAVTIGTGSGARVFIAPAHGTKVQATLTIQNALTFDANATYTYTFKAKGRKSLTDKVVADGVTINNGAIFAFRGKAQGALRQGIVLTVIDNTSATPIAGTFSNLPDGAILTVNGNNFQASYEGGDGNDLTLTVVP